MNRTRHQHTILSAALLAVVLAAPASAADRSGPTRGSLWATARQGLALALAGWFGPSSGWTGAWGEDGLIIDPNGQKVSPPPPTPPWTAAWGEDGVIIDPDGRKVSPPPPLVSADSTATASAEGNTIDPDG